MFVLFWVCDICATVHSKLIVTHGKYPVFRCNDNVLILIALVYARYQFKPLEWRCRPLHQGRVEMNRHEYVNRRSCSLKPHEYLAEQFIEWRTACVNAVLYNLCTWFKTLHINFFRSRQTTRPFLGASILAGSGLQNLYRFFVILFADYFPMKSITLFTLAIQQIFSIYTAPVNTILSHLAQSMLPPVWHIDMTLQHDSDTGEKLKPLKSERKHDETGWRHKFMV